MDLDYEDELRVKELKERRHVAFRELWGRLIKDAFADIEGTRIELYAIRKELENIEGSHEHHKAMAKRARELADQKTAKRSKDWLKERAAGATWKELAAKHRIQGGTIAYNVRRAVARVRMLKRQEFKDREIDIYDLSAANLTKVVKLLDEGI